MRLEGDVFNVYFVFALRHIERAVFYDRDILFFCLLFFGRSCFFRAVRGRSCRRSASCSRCLRSKFKFFSYDLGDISFSVLAVPCAGLQSSFYINQRTFRHILRGDFGLFSPQYNAVKLRFFSFLAGSIFPGPIGGYPERANALSRSSAPHFRVGSHSADKKYFI